MVLFPELKRDWGGGEKRLVWRMTGAVLEAVGRKNESKPSSSGLEIHKDLWAGLVSHGCNDIERGFASPVFLGLFIACWSLCELHCSLLCWFEHGKLRINVSR